MAKRWNSPRLRDAVMLTIIALVVIAILFSWLSKIICIASGVLFFLLLFVLAYLWETADIEHDAKVAAREMSKIDLDENRGWRELLFHGDFKVLAMRKGTKTALAIYFFVFFGEFFILILLLYFSYPKNDLSYLVVLLIIFAVLALIKAYAKKKTYDLALEMLEKGEVEGYKEPEPTFPIGGEDED
jgi:FtsH-binding integral membrane protein